MAILELSEPKSKEDLFQGKNPVELLHPLDVFHRTSRSSLYSGAPRGFEVPKILSIQCPYTLIISGIDGYRYTDIIHPADCARSDRGSFAPTTDWFSIYPVLRDLSVEELSLVSNCVFYSAHNQEWQVSCKYPSDALESMAERGHFFVFKDKKAIESLRALGHRYVEKSHLFYVFTPSFLSELNKWKTH